MQFIDLKTQYQRIKAGVDKRFERIFETCQFVMGPEVFELEEKLAEFSGVKHCISVASGTDSLLVAMMALNIGPGDEIITTPFTFISTAEVIVLLGAKPVFVDIDPKTYNLNPEQLEAAITLNTKLILPVDLFGQSADYDAIKAIAAKHNIPVVDDAAQSIGGTYKDRPIGSLAQISTTSFFPAKPLGCYGEGGACYTDDDNLALVMRQIRDHGQDKRYHHPRVGINGRLDTLQAAVLLEKLTIFPEELKARQAVAEKYNALLKDYVVTPYVEPFNTSAYAQYTIQVDNRDAVREKLQTKDIPTAIHYPVPLYKQEVFKPYAFEVLPVSEAVSNRVMSLPMHPYLTDEAIETIAKGVIAAL